jgi:hypothetical protein
VITFSTKNIKLFVLAVLALNVVAFSLISRESPTYAQTDDTLTKIAAYQRWTRINKELIRGASLDSLMTVAAEPDAGGG